MVPFKWYFFLWLTLQALSSQLTFQSTNPQLSKQQSTMYLASQQFMWRNNALDSKWQYLPHCKSIMPECVSKEWQIRFAISVSDTTPTVYNLWWTRQIGFGNTPNTIFRYSSVGPTRTDRIGDAKYNHFFLVSLSIRVDEGFETKVRSIVSRPALVHMHKLWNVAGI